jgi:hypothetical protein
MGAPGCAGLTRATEITFLEDSCLWTDPLSNTLDVVDVVERTAVGRVRVPWVRKFTATPNALFLLVEPIDFLQEGWR